MKIDRKLRNALANVHTEPGEVPQLEVEIDGEKLDLPLEHTHVDARAHQWPGRSAVRAASA